ncbi:MAG: hypothetical protein RL226_758 [Bacteroidota bacterium]
MKYVFLFFSLIACAAFGQDSKRVLFLGNSYTAVNNLPQMLADLATSVNDEVIFDSNTPGGYTLEGHSTNTTSLQKIALGNWDFVVLQEQSQLPSFPDSQVEADVFPYATALNNLILESNACTETVFYMTWGRKNGDAQNCANWPPVCTYEGMDDLLYQRYTQMGEDNEALVSPVGRVWRYLRDNYPDIELYSADESHPSYAGTYAAACTFYTVLFRKNPSALTFNGTLTAETAAIIREAAKLVVYEQLDQWFVGMYDPQPNFTFASANLEVTFTNQSEYANTFSWNFGNGTTSTDENPIYTYASPGAYTVELTAGMCGVFSTIEQTIEVGTIGISDQKASVLKVYPNPTNDVLYLSEPANVTVINAHGETVLQTFVTSSVDVRSLSPGMYTLRTEENTLTAVRFIKQ